MSLPHGAMNWSEICDYAISCLYSLIFFLFLYILCVWGGRGHEKYERVWRTFMNIKEFIFVSNNY